MIGQCNNKEKYWEFGVLIDRVQLYMLAAGFNFF